ncbi:AMP-binding protein [Arsenicicoccus dermatophilus]|uniref:AMP-binding protein n=1 Tax=Arsenicicoccus dermatophilus TaxID=1076331 RepID=UPI0038914439
MSRPVVTWPAPGATAHEVVADLSVLEAAMAGTGPAVAVPGVLDRPEQVRVPEETAVVIATSGTTGRPKPALLTADALRHAVHGLADVLGTGQSMLAVPPTHITGIAVILRNLAAGRLPLAVAPGHFGPQSFVDAWARRDRSASRHFCTLVPTQLRRLLASPDALAAARELDAIIVGAAPLPAADAALARRLGLRIVVGYGCSETAGGCLYDGRLLPGLSASLDPDGRLRIGGPQVALGYLGRPGGDAFAQDAAGVRWYRTDDLARRGPDGAIEILGRVDDVINTGGLKVAPVVVEDALGLARVPGLGAAMVVGVPDPEWGETVAVLAVPAGAATGPTAPGDQPAGTSPTLADVRAALADHLPSHALPRALHLVGELPLVGPGKPDRRRARELVSAR